MESFRARGIGPKAALLLGAQSLDEFTDEDLKEVPTAQLVNYVPLSRFLTISREDLVEHATVEELVKAGFKLDDLIGRYEFFDLYPQFSIATLRHHFTPKRIFALIDGILSTTGLDVVKDDISLRELRGIGFTASEIIRSQYYNCGCRSFADAGFNVKEMLETNEQRSDTMSHYTLQHCRAHLSLNEIVEYSTLTMKMDLSPFLVEELNNWFSGKDIMKQLVKKLRLNGDDVVSYLEGNYEPDDFFTEVSPFEMMQVREKDENFDHRLKQWFPQLKDYNAHWMFDLDRGFRPTKMDLVHHTVYTMVFFGKLGTLIDKMKTDDPFCRAVCSSKLIDIFSPVQIIAYFGDLATNDELRNFDLPLDVFLSKMPATCVRVYGVDHLIVSGLNTEDVRRAAGAVSRPNLSSDAVRLICESKQGDWLKLMDYSIEDLHAMGCKFEHVHEVYGISYCGVFGVAEYKKADVKLPILLEVFTMQELIEGWGDRIDFARHCRQNFTLIDLADFFSVEELVTAGYELQEILQCSFELQDVCKSFSAQDLCYKHLRGNFHADYLNASRLKDFYSFQELCFCFPLADLMRNYDLAVVINGIKFGVYNAMNIDAVGSNLGVDCTIRNLRWNGLTLDHIPKENLDYWKLPILHPHFSMNDLVAQYGMVEITKGFSLRELAKHFPLQDLMGHFSCLELIGTFDFKPNNRLILLGCLMRDLALVDEQPMTSIGQHILRDKVPVLELIRFVRHRKEFKRIGLNLRDLRKMGLSCVNALNLGYKIDSLRGGGYTCEDIRHCGLDHVFAAHAGFSLLEIQDAMTDLMKVDLKEVQEILTWGCIDF